MNLADKILERAEALARKQSIKKISSNGVEHEIHYITVEQLRRLISVSRDELKL